jgi:hypothetical protein
MSNLVPGIDFIQFSYYGLANPDWFIRSINAFMDSYDLDGLSSGRIKGLKASRQHPLVAMLTTALQDGKADNAISLLPAISVSAGGKSAEDIPIGQGMMTSVLIDETTVSQMESDVKDPASFMEQILLSPTGVKTLRSYLTLNNGTAYASRNQFRFRDSATISVWAATIDEAILMERLITAYLIESRAWMVSAHAADISVRTDAGLINTNFGRVIHGIETTISFQHAFTTYQVFRQKPIDGTALEIDVNGLFVPTGSSTSDPGVSVYS